MGRGALWRDNQQSTFAHIHTSSSHSTASPWSPIPYPHCVSTQGQASEAGGGLAAARRRVPGKERMAGTFGKWAGDRFRDGCCGSTRQITAIGT